MHGPQVLGGGTGGTEVDLYLNYKHEFNNDIALTIGATDYTYTRNPGINTMEYSIVLDVMGYEFYIGYIDEYFGADSSSMYYNLSKSFTLSEEKNLGLSLALGYTSHDDEAKIGSKSYMDYKVAITRSVGQMDYEFFYTNTNRKTISGSTETEAKDSSTGVMLKFNM